MIFFVLIGGLGLLALPGLVRGMGSHLPPRCWAALCGFALSAGSVLVLSFLLLMSAPRLLVAANLSTWAHICERMLGRLSPGGLPVALSSAILLVMLCVLGFCALRDARRSVEWAQVGFTPNRAGGSVGRFDVVVVPSQRLCALSVPATLGRPAQVVLTQGVVEALSDEELEIVCAHEAAHLDRAHHRQLAVALAVESAFRWWPPARSSCRAIRLALERTADEVAAGASVRRRGLLCSALLAVAGVPPTRAVAAFSAVDGLVERIDALSGAPRTSRATWWTLVLIPGVLVGLASMVGLGWWGHQAWHALSMASHCPLR